MVDLKKQTFSLSGFRVFLLSRFRDFFRQRAAPSI